VDRGPGGWDSLRPQSRACSTWAASPVSSAATIRIPCLRALLRVHALQAFDPRHRRDSRATVSSETSAVEVPLRGVLRGGSAAFAATFRSGAGGGLGIAGARASAGPPSAGGVTVGDAAASSTRVVRGVANQTAAAIPAAATVRSSVPFAPIVPSVPAKRVRNDCGRRTPLARAEAAGTAPDDTIVPGTIASLARLGGSLGGAFLGEGELAALVVDDDAVAGADLACEETAGDLVLDVGSG